LLLSSALLAAHRPLSTAATRTAALLQMSFIDHERINVAKTARQVAERAPTGKPKVSRVTSGHGKDIVPLSQVCLKPKKRVIWA